MKAVLSNRIYLEVDAQYGEFLKEELTYKIPSYVDPDNPLIIRNFSQFRPGIMTIPIGRTDLIPSGHEIVDKRVLNPANFPEFKYELRPSQALVHDDIADNALINAKVSWGKTFTGMAIAGKLGQKTLVVVHTLALMHQWGKEVKKVYGFEPGLIGGGHENFNAPIVVGNVQSLYTRMPRIAKMFGTLIMDEVHHAPSMSFSKVVDGCYSRYKIGLSGTLERKDGRHVVIRDYFGKKVYSPPKENSMHPVVHVLPTNIYFPDSQQFGWAEKVTLLQESSVYRNMIVAVTEKYAAMGHKVLVVSDRTDFLKYVAGQLNSALIIGPTKDRDGEFAKLNRGDTNILCGTLSIFKEGISHDPLSCVVMGTPINNEPMLEQLIGRIVRVVPGKIQPVVVDPLLKGRTVEKQFMNRVGHYMKQGYDIIYL